MTVLGKGFYTSLISIKAEWTMQQPKLISRLLKTFFLRFLQFPVEWNEGRMKFAWLEGESFNAGVDGLEIVVTS